MRTILLTAALALVAEDADDKNGGKALDKFEGGWELVSGEVDGKGRPTSFSTKAGSGHLLHVWKRVKE
jgi:hypothetical protein